MSTLKVDTILKRTGTGTITLGQSGDTIAMPAATLTTALPVAQGGTGSTTLAGAGLVNTPAFEVQLSGNQSTSADTWTKVTFDTELFDTDNTFASNKFTPGESGKYLLGASLAWEGLGNAKTAYCAIYKNGSQYNSGITAPGVGAADTATINIIVDSNTTDYFEVYALQNDSTINLIGNSAPECVFWGCKLIGI